MPFWKKDHSYWSRKRFFPGKILDGPNIGQECLLTRDDLQSQARGQNFTKQ